MHFQKGAGMAKAEFRKPPAIGGAIASLILALALAAPSAAQTVLTGNIFGSVSDEQGARLPGVTVGLTGVGAPRTQTTDSRGEYRFVNLDPGSYTMVYELQGFTKVTKTGVQVSVGQNTSTSATLTLSTVEAAVTVTGEAALLDTRKIETGAIVDQTELQKIPTARDPWVILQTVPGVNTDRLNVGGNESGQQSIFVSKGTSADQAVWNLDGTTITDMAALGSSPAYFDFDSFEEINATTGGSDVTAVTPGVQLNLVTKRGTNDLHGSARLYLAQEEWQSTNLPDEALAQGFRGGNRIDEVQDYGVEIGGPLIRDRLWLWGAYGRNQIDLRTINNVSDKTTLEDVNGKLNAQIVDSLSAVASYTMGDKIKLGRNAGPFRPAPAAWNQEGPTSIYKGELSWVASQNAFLTASYSYVDGGFSLTPAGGLGVLNVFQDQNGVWQNGYYFLSTVRPQHQAAANGSFFFGLGATGHELKYGFNYRTTTATSEISWPGNGNYGDLFNFGRPVAFLTRQQLASSDQEYTSVYLSDTITLGAMTINAGLRYDMQSGNNVGAEVPANSLFPEILPGIAGVDEPEIFEWNDVSPRIGLSYALGARQKTVARASYARYADQLGAGIVTFNNSASIAGIYYDWSDDGDRIVEPGEVDTANPLGFYGFDPSNPSATFSPNIIDPNLEAGLTDEFIVGLEHEILTDFVVGVSYTHRDYDGALIVRGNGLTAADYEFVRNVEGTLPDGTPYSEPLYGLRDGVGVPAGSTLENRRDWNAIYDGIDLTLQKRLSNRWMARASVTLSDSKQEGGPGSCFDPTNNRGGAGNTWGGGIGLYSVGTCSGDDTLAPPAGAISGAKNEIFLNSSWQFNLAGLYQLPAGFAISASVFAREGYPLIYFDREDPGDGLGPRDVIIGGIDERRYEDVINVDARIEKVLTLSPLQITLTADVFNVFNDNAIIQRNGRVDVPAASLNRLIEVQSPRVVRAGARISF
jgi:hypothetical protein